MAAGAVVFVLLIVGGFALAVGRGGRFVAAGPLPQPSLSLPDADGFPFVLPPSPDRPRNAPPRRW